VRRLQHQGRLGCMQVADMAALLEHLAYAALTPPGTQRAAG
jgi:hypothetical protein